MWIRGWGYLTIIRQGKTRVQRDERWTSSLNPKSKFQNNGSYHNFSEEALERLVEVVNDIDHFREVYFPNPTADFYDFNLVAILDGLKLLYSQDNDRILEAGL